MFANGRGTNWNFPTWEQEQEMKRMAEIQARAYQEAADRARKAQRGYGAQEGPAKLSQMSQYIVDAVTSASNYEAKRQQSLKKAQEMQSKGGISAAIGSILEAISK